MSLQASAPVRIYPIDDTDRDSTFRSYVHKLQAAVSALDSSALRKLTADDVVVGPREKDKGWQRFVEVWRPNDRNDPELWDALSELLSLGFVREHPSLYVSPYVAWRFPNDLDPRTHLVVIRDGAALRLSPGINAPISATLSFDIVGRISGAATPAGDNELRQWVYVRTLDGRTGYLNARDVRSPLMPRAQFARKNGKWKMVALEGR